MVQNCNLPHRDAKWKYESALVINIMVNASVKTMNPICVSHYEEMCGKIIKWPV